MKKKKTARRRTVPVRCANTLRKLKRLVFHALKMRYELRGRVAMTLRKTVNLITGLAIVFHFQLGFMKLKSVHGKSEIHS